MNRFGMPEGYRENPAITFDVETDSSYWNRNRVSTAVSYQRAVYDWADDLIREHALRTVADVGCGFAYKLDWLHQRHPEVDFCGIDQPSAIRLCQQHYAFGRWIGVDLAAPERPDRRFDLVIASDVIEHLENPDTLLDFVHDLIAPGGRALISTVERDRLRGAGCRHSPNPEHVREWNRGELARYLTGRGFRVVDHRILPARAPSLSRSYVSKRLRRLISGKSMHYSQAVVLQDGRAG